ncbi:HNH endonuclease signature motif containing protein [Cryobacterium sp. HLT2-28]|uniref:HNH endonuclease signature motif containing protein n=1 Tax=Cryobacterium sp. HLT2-28 TaxID=1259146 RepID=UPI00141BA7A3|nr:HNH endonuclease signature motif containing protein [Cryobacterium sp. HLT2-28]
MTILVNARQEALGERFDAIKEAERDIARAFARRAELIDEARRYREETAAMTVASAACASSLSRWNESMIAEREFVSELACTLLVPQRTAETVIAESRALADDLPGTRAALQRGEISYRNAQTLMGQACSVPADAKAAFEAALLPSAANLTASKLKTKARMLRERLHPETITARHDTSITDRKVSVEPETDGMASLYWYDTAEQIDAAYRRITTTALSLQGPEEPRTLTQLRADVLKDLLIDGVTPAGLAKGIRATVHVTVPVLTLMGLSEEPAHLAGYGPIDPETARRLAAGAPSFTRLLTHPETGVVLSVGRDRYKVPKDLKRYVQLRDETCRFPGCNRPAHECDLDHTLDWQFQGCTEHENLASVCAGDHGLKSETGWTAKQLPGGVIEWTSPTGRHFRTEPAVDIRPSPPRRVPAPPPPVDPAEPAEPPPF